MEDSKIDKGNIVAEKPSAFALQTIKMYQYLSAKQNGFALSKQLSRSEMSIAAWGRESGYARSNQDFIHRLSTALKEANETKY